MINVSLFLFLILFQTHHSHFQRECV
uniref:Uncharacterized protein n=1 Tax=Rhizophora mucronata TaxID=61149 RepID=A0A2P2MF76_RHIMU